jgi:hypothetical protein
MQDHGRFAVDSELALFPKMVRELLDGAPTVCEHERGTIAKATPEVLGDAR